MGLLSKMYERKGKGMRQSGIKGFMNTGSAPPGAPTRTPTSASGVASKEADGGTASPGTWKVSSTQAGAVSGATPGVPEGGATTKKGPDPFDFESSFDASVSPASVGGAVRPAAGAKLAPTTGSPVGMNRPALVNSPATATATASNPFLPTPSKRRRVTFAEVDEYSLVEDDPSDEEAEGDDIPMGGDAEDSDADDAAVPESPEMEPWKMFGTPKSEVRGQTAAAAAATPAWVKQPRSPPVMPSPSARTPPGRDQTRTALEVAAAAGMGKIVADGSEVSGSLPRGMGLPESGEDLANVDEAQYALAGLGEMAPAAGRLTSAVSLVTLAADPRRRRVLTSQGLAPNMMRAACQVCGGGAGAETVPGDGPSRATRFASAALLYLASLDLRAKDAIAAFDAAAPVPILPVLLRAAVKDGDGAMNDGRSVSAAATLGVGGFRGLLAGRAEARAEKSIREALQALKFLPHEEVDAPSLALLATHRALTQQETVAAMASANEGIRGRSEGDGGDDAGGLDDNTGEGSEAVGGWGALKSQLASSGTMLEVARLADVAARDICELGAGCFSRGRTDGDASVEEEEGNDGHGSPEVGGGATETAAASRAMARLYRCMRVVEAATFGSQACADAVVAGDLSPGPGRPRGGHRAALALVPMRTNAAIASPAPVGLMAAAAPEVKEQKAMSGDHDEAAVLAEVVNDCRVKEINLSPPASPSGAGSKRRLKDEEKDSEDEAVLEKKFRTVEALLLTPSPGKGRGIGMVNRRGNGEGIDTAMEDALGSPPVGVAGGGSKDGTPTFNFNTIAAAVDASIAWLDDGAGDRGAEAGMNVGSGMTGEDVEAGWTILHSLLRVLPTLAVAAAAAAYGTRAGDTLCGVVIARDGGLGVDPRLAAETLRSVIHVLTNLTNENPAGCKTVRDAGGVEAAAALIPWFASLEGFVPGTGPSKAVVAKAAVRANGAWLGAAARRDHAREKEDSGAAASGADMLNASLCFLVNLAEMDDDVCKALRSMEADVGALEERRGGRRVSGSKRSGMYTRPLGLVELLAQIFVRSGGAGPVDENGNIIAASSGGDVEGGTKATVRSEKDDGEVTAEMLDVNVGDDKEGDGLITQAYAALLVAFLIEGQPALRADVMCTLPEGGLASLAGVLERFRTFHENLESISSASHTSLSRVIRWLKGN